MRIMRKITSLLLLLTSTHAFSTTYQLPSTSSDIIGDVQYQSASTRENIAKTAYQYDVGYNAIVSANPQYHRTMLFNSDLNLQIPTKHLLPDRAKRGIVINLPEMRMYYFPKDSNTVRTYPIGIGKVGKNIPMQKAYVARKATNPTWYPPQDIIDFNREQGVNLPKVMPPGPDNPLGTYAIYMSIPTYLIHSTIFPESIGRRASFGCIRMYEADIEEFYPTVSRGVPIDIIDEPVKLGWQTNKLYLEMYDILEDSHNANKITLPSVVNTVTDKAKNDTTLIDWQGIMFVVNEKDGIPHEIGVKLPV